MTMEVPDYMQNVLQETLAVDNQAAFMRLSPHYLYKPRLFPDGDHWCALLGDDIQIGVCGFGDTPETAMRAFDKAWGTPIQEGGK